MNTKYLLIHVQETNQYKLGILEDLMKAMCGTTEVLGVFSESELPLAKKILGSLNPN